VPHDDCETEGCGRSIPEHHPSCKHHVIAGVTVFLQDVYRIPALVSPGPFLGALLGLLHVIPLAFIGLCSAKLHVEAEQLRHRATQTAEEREAERLARIEQQRIEDEAFERNLERQRRERRAQIELEQEEARARLIVEAQQRDLELKAQAEAAGSRQS
jgi:uncharacterized membrane protein